MNRNDGLAAKKPRAAAGLAQKAPAEPIPRPENSSGHAYAFACRRPPHRRPARYFSVGTGARRAGCLAAMGFCLAWLSVFPIRSAAAQQTDSQDGQDAIGIRHKLYVSVALNSGAPVGTKGDDLDKGLVRLLIFVSDHSREATFYGGVPASFSDFDSANVAPARLVWKQDICHQNRGLPKISVGLVEGVLSASQMETSVSATTRHIGKLLPYDEIQIDRNLTKGADDLGQYMEQRVHTTASHILVDLKTYTEACIVQAKDHK
jgi:hypothetical protein